MQFRVFIFCSCLLLIFTNQICAQARIEEKKTAKFTLGNQGYFPIRRKPTKEQKKLLLPSDQDAKSYTRLLGQPGTGMFRLLPDLECEANTLVIKATETCLNAIPESSFYSFREQEHTQEILADIRLKNNHLISDGILSQGILTELGDVSLENLTTASKGLKFLNEYEPNVLNKEAQKQFMQMAKGVKFGEYEYRKIVPVRENTTYALRVIAYKGNIVRSYRGYRFDLLAGDKRIDLTLAFRVVRQDKDGAVTIVWKELARKESPKLKFERRKTQ
ncbi:MAG TPA: hypothetical protein VF556_03780 [Pyrinomonadaceae bacterium]|jgi:hypothetical protein